MSQTMDGKFKYQARFERVPGKSVTTTQGAVIQTGYPGEPKVEVSLTKQCELTYFLDDEEIDLEADADTGSDKLEFYAKGKFRSFIYESDVTLKINFRSYRGDCLLSTYLCLPAELAENDIVGILGSPDNFKQNDFMSRAGEAADPQPESRMARNQHCTSTWCIPTEQDNLFKDPRHTCSDAFDEVLDEKIRNVSEEIKEACEDRLACIVDTIEADGDIEEGVRTLKEEDEDPEAPNEEKRKADPAPPKEVIPVQPEHNSLILVGEWFAPDLSPGGDPGGPDESLIAITENDIEFPNGGGGFANGPYAMDPNTSTYTAYEGDETITFELDGDQLKVRFAGGNYGDATAVFYNKISSEEFEELLIPEPQPEPQPEPKPEPEPVAPKSGPDPTPKKASSSGDPHFKTWTGDKYDYHGECDLVLIDDPQFNNGQGLKVHIRTTRVKYFSFIEKAAVQIGGDILEFSNDLEGFLINGAKLEANKKHHKTLLGGFVVRRDQKALSIRLGKEARKTGHIAKIDLHTRKNGFPAIIIDAGTTDIFKGSLGLLGEWGTGRMLARDGKTEFTEVDVMDAEDFALEWQVRDTEPMLFQESRFPQFPLTCAPAKKMPKTRLGYSKQVEEAQEACSHWKEDKEDCVFDVLATRDVDVALEGHLVHVA